MNSNPPTQKAHIVDLHAGRQILNTYRADEANKLVMMAQGYP
jgi:hypothetical protein